MALLLCAVESAPNVACFHPLKGYLKRGGGWTPKATDGYLDMPKSVPCGQCIGCRLERSRQWAVRCVHEAQLHKSNVFITLTYNDQKMPVGRSLDYVHFQKFMKRLRFKMGSNIRFYMCGEYGDQFKRPHYHALLFNVDFADKYMWRKTKSGFPQYRSKTLEDLWTDPDDGISYGNCEIGTVTFESAAYCARYIMKKITGHAAQSFYTDIDLETGEYTERVPEFNNMSRRPGIGKGWLDKYSSEVYPNDFVVMRGVKMKPPRFYDNHYELLSPDEYEIVKKKRVEDTRKHVDNNTPERLAVREHCAQAKLTRLVRPVE